MDYKKIQESIAGRFTRIDYTDKHITVQLAGNLSARDLAPEQIENIKRFYNKPDSTVEIVKVKPYKNELLRLNC